MDLRAIKEYYRARLRAVSLEEGSGAYNATDKTKQLLPSKRTDFKNKTYHPIKFN